MAVSRGERLRKNAAKAKKRKAVATQKLAAQRKELAISKPRHVDLATSPIVDCLLSADFEAKGQGDLMVTRQLSLGRYALAEFVIDLKCFGVEEAFFRVQDADERAEFLEVLADSGDVAIAPGRARRLLQDAAAFGAANGFPPPPEFAEIARMLADCAPEGESFPLGDEGRPHYVVEPHEDPDDVAMRVAILTDALGPSGFDVSYPLEEENSGEG